jgi:hypothetical protein
MTAYFDDLERKTIDLSDAHRGDDAAFLRGLETLEEALKRDVLLNTGDREFPDDLRELALTAIARDAISGPLTMIEKCYDKQRRMALAGRRSLLIGSLHSLFHKVAGRRIPTRFGRWSDDPAGNLRVRDAHDSEPRS